MLLDEFLSTVVTEKAEARRRQLESQAKASVSVVKEWPLDPLIAGLVTFASDGDLEEKINFIYDRMDQDESGAMSFDEVNEGLKMYSNTLGQTVSLSKDDWYECTLRGSLLNSEGELGPLGFQKMIKLQLRRYTERKLAELMSKLEVDFYGDPGPHMDQVTCLSLKMLMRHVQQLTDKMAVLHEHIHPGVDEDELRLKRTRKQVMLTLKNMPLKKALETWKDNALGHDYQERFLNDRDFLAGRIERLENSLEQVLPQTLNPKP